MPEHQAPADQLQADEIERLHLSLQAAGIGTWDYDLRTQQMQWSAICKELFGLPADLPVTAAMLLEQVHPDDRQPVAHANAQMSSPLSNGEHYIRFRILMPENALRWVEVKGKATRDAQGQIIRFSGVVQDVTERTLTRQKLEESEARYHALIEESPVATCLLMGPQLRIELANETMLRYWGRDRSVIGQPHAQALPELAGQPFGYLLNRVFTTGQAYSKRAAPAQLMIDGEPVSCYFDFTYKPLRYADGPVYGILATSVEVTEQVKTQQQLVANEARLRSIIEQAPMAIGLFSGREMIIEVGNKRIFEVWDKDVSIIGLPVIEALPEIKGQGYIELLEGVYDSGEPFVGNSMLVNLQRRGRLQAVYFDLVYTPLRDTANRITGVMVLATEVTDQVLAHQKVEESEARYRTLSESLEQLVQKRTQELASANQELGAANQEMAESTSLLVRSNDNLQQFAYIASHDLQEPLRKIQQFGDVLKEKFADQLGEGVDYLNRMQTAASRMSSLIRDLLAYSRISTQRDTSTLVSLTEVVSKVLTDLELMVAETNAAIRVDPLPTLPGDASQLGQLFQNLLSNALKFRRREVAPVITIRSSLVAADHLPKPVKPARSALIYHRIEVTDNGIGFEEKYLDRIFQVFQRLHGKKDFAGTGIGLAVCEKVATNHGGAITATSTPGQGASFSVYLPV